MTRGNVDRGGLGPASATTRPIGVDPDQPACAAPSREARRSGLLVGTQVLGFGFVLISILYPTRAAFSGSWILYVAAFLAMVSVPILWRRRSAIVWIAAAYVALAAISFGWTVSQTLSSYALAGFILVSFPAMAGGALLNSRWLLIAIAASSAYAATVVAGTRGLEVLNLLSIYNANTHAKLLLAACVALAGTLSMSSRNAVRLLAWLPFVAFIPTMLDSGSTQAAVGWATAALVLLAWRWIKRRSQESAMPAIVLIALALSGVLLALMPVFWGQSALDQLLFAGGRGEIWSYLLGQCDLGSCFRGGGVGTIADQLAGFSDPFGPIMQAHNMYVVTIRELGVIGLLLILGMVLVVVRLAVRCESPAFPALIFAVLPWTLTSDIINVADSFVLTIVLAVAAHLGRSHLHREDERERQLL